MRCRSVGRTTRSRRSRPSRPVARARRTSMARRRWLMAAVVVLAAVGLGAATWTDVRASSRSSREQDSLMAAQRELATLRHDVALTRYATAVTTYQQHQLEST